MNFDFILYSVLTALLFIYCGIGLTFLLCPLKFEKYAIFLSPFVGLSYLGAITWWGIHLVPGGINAFVTPLMLLPALFIGAAVFTRKKRLSSLLTGLNREICVLLLVCCFIFLLISIPEIFLLNNFNVLVIGNNDIINYAVISKSLTGSSVINPMPGIDAQTLFLIENNNFGAFIAAAVPSVVFSIQTYMVQNSIENLFFIFSLPIIYIIAVEIFGYRPPVAIIAAFLVGLNFHLIYILYTGFVGQIIGDGIFLALLSVTLYPIMNCTQDKEFWDYIPLSFILLFGLIATYSPFLPFFFLPIFGFLILTGIMKENLKMLIPTVKFLFITTIIGILIAIPLAINRIKELLYFSQGLAAGWYVPIVSPEQIVGIVGNDVGWLPIWDATNHSTPVPFIVRFFLSIIIICILFLSLRKLFQSDKKVFYFGIVFFVVIFIGYIYYIALEVMSPSFTGEGYKAYKLLTFGIPLIIIIFLVYFQNVDIFNPRKENWYCILILFFLIAGNLWSSIAMMDMVSQKSYPIKSNIIDLQKINDYQNVTSINVEESNYSDQMWIYYFLFMNKTLHLKYSTYFNKSPLIGEWNLNSSHEDKDILILKNADEMIPLNDDYHLVKNTSSLYVNFKDGWYEPQINKNGAYRWTGKNRENPSLGISASNLTTLNLDLSYSPLYPNNSFSVEIDNKKISSCTDTKYCEIKQLTITPGYHTLTFEPKVPSLSPGPADPRTLGYAFIFINITSNTSNLGGTA